MNKDKLVTVQEAAEGLLSGKTILYPTDTIWGIGCDASNEKAIKAIEEMKNRPNNKTFILLVESVPMLERYVKHIPDVAYDLIDLAEKPLTIIYDSPINLSESLLAEDGSIGIRVTNDSNCRRLIQRLKKPLISTSANLSGEPIPTSFNEVHESIKSNVDLILNDRLQEVMNKPSSIIKLSNDGKVKVIR